MAEAEDRSSYANEGKVEAAEKLALASGFRVLTTTIDTGREQIAIAGTAQAIRDFAPVLEKEGWHPWPPAPDSDSGVRQDFSLGPPPDGIISGWWDDTYLVLRELPPAKERFFYRGPGSFLLTAVIGVAGLLANIYYSQVFRLFIPREKLLFASITAFIIIAVFEFFFCWFGVVADDRGIRLRRHLFGSLQEIPYPAVKSATILVENHETRRIFSLNLKEGRSIDLGLPARCQPDLLALIRARIGGG